jgi:Uma2 family endonuclease
MAVGEVTALANSGTQAQTRALQRAQARQQAEAQQGMLVTGGRWSAQRALDELPETPEMIVEVFAGSLLVSPRPSRRHQDALLELAYRMNRAARVAGLRASPEINLVIGDELAAPDILVVTNPEEKGTWTGVEHALLVVEILSPSDKQPRRILHRQVYADGGIPWFLSVEFRRVGPVMTLSQLLAGGYETVTSAQPGEVFAMTEPFEFRIDPADLDA